MPAQFFDGHRSCNLKIRVSGLATRDILVSMVPPTCFLRKQQLLVGPGLRVASLPACILAREETRILVYFYRKLIKQSI